MDEQARAAELRREWEPGPYPISPDWTPEMEAAMEARNERAGAVVVGSEYCQACGRQSHVGFSVPNDVWQAAVPSGYRGGPFADGGCLCVVCFASFADERLIPWDDDIQFWPVSLRTSFRLAGLEVLPKPETNSGAADV